MTLRTWQGLAASGAPLAFGQTTTEMTGKSYNNFPILSLNTKPSRAGFWPITDLFVGARAGEGLDVRAEAHQVGAFGHVASKFSRLER
jgi:hypothetical protein